MDILGSCRLPGWLEVLPLSLDLTVPFYSLPSAKTPVPPLETKDSRSLELGSLELGSLDLGIDPCSLQSSKPRGPGRSAGLESLLDSRIDAVRSEPYIAVGVAI